jgi:hypothetical protein
MIASEAAIIGLLVLVVFEIVGVAVWRLTHRHRDRGDEHRVRPNDFWRR